MTEFDYELFAIRYATRDARRSAHLSAAIRTMGRCRWIASCGWQGWRSNLCHRYRLQRGSIGEAPTHILAMSRARARDARHRCECGRRCHSDPSALRSCGQFRPLSEARFHLQERELGLCHRALHAISAAVAHSFRGRGRLRDCAPELCAPRRILRWRRRARSRPHDTCGRAAIRPGLQFVRVRTRRGFVVLASDVSHFMKTWRVSARFRPPFISAKCWRVRPSAGIGAGRGHIVPGHDPLVMKLYPAPSPELEGHRRTPRRAAIGGRARSLQIIGRGTSDLDRSRPKEIRSRSDALAVLISLLRLLVK